jgi:hypothetical protein
MLSNAHDRDQRAQENKFRLEDMYKPSEDVRTSIFDIYDKFIRWRAQREQPFKQFNGGVLTHYLNEARQKFWGYLPLSYDTDTPQFFFPETRNEVIKILARIANLKIKPTFDGVEGFDLIKASVLKNLFEYWKRGANRKIQNFWQFLYAVINGTVITFVAYKSDKRKVKNIKYYDESTGETKCTEEEIDDSDVDETIVNLEDFYFPKIWEPDLQKQDECIWRTLIKWTDFQTAFKGYALKDMVLPGSQFADNSIFTDFLSYDVRGGEFVEIIKYFNKAKDQYMLIANGVLLNPMMVDSVDSVSPLPWNHKKLPFAKTVFEPIDTNFFYGKPLPQLIKSAQEALNKFWELAIDRETRAVARPIITNDPSIELGLEFKAGHVYQVQADPSSYKELAMDPVSSSYWNAMTSLQGIINKTAGGGVGPIITSRQPRSASEKQLEATQQKESAGIYYLFYQDLLEQKLQLVIENMIQFYTALKTEKIMGSRNFHKILSINDAQLFGGGVGNVELRITEKPEKSEKLLEESYMRSLFKKEKVEIIEVSPKALRDLKFDIKVDFEPENTPETEKLLYLDYVTTLMNLFGQSGLVSQKKVLFRLSEKYGESLSDIVEDTVMQEYEQERFGITKPAPIPQQGGAQATGMKLPNANQMPGVNEMNSQLRGQMMGAQGPGQRMVNEGVAPRNILKNF